MNNPITLAKNEFDEIKRFIQIVKIIVDGFRGIVQKINDLDKPQTEK